MAFPTEEIAYLRSQPLARLATHSPEGQPDVVPVAFEFDGEFFLDRRIGSLGPVHAQGSQRRGGRQRCCDGRRRHGVVRTFIVRGIRIYGLAPSRSSAREWSVQATTCVSPDGLLELEHAGCPRGRHLVRDAAMPPLTRSCPRTVETHPGTGAPGRARLWHAVKPVHYGRR